MSQVSTEQHDHNNVKVPTEQCDHNNVTAYKKQDMIVKWCIHVCVLKLAFAFEVIWSVTSVAMVTDSASSLEVRRRDFESLTLI